MIMLRVVSWAAFGGGAVCLVALLGTGDWFFLTPAISGGVSGAVFAAMDRAISILEDIAGSVKAGGRNEVQVEQAIVAPAEVRAPRSIDELSRDLERMKSALDA